MITTTGTGDVEGDDHYLVIRPNDVRGISGTEQQQPATAAAATTTTTTRCGWTDMPESKQSERQSLAEWRSPHSHTLCAHTVRSHCHTIGIRVRHPVVSPPSLPGVPLPVGKPQCAFVSINRSAIPLREGVVTRGREKEGGYDDYYERGATATANRYTLPLMNPTVLLLLLSPLADQGASQVNETSPYSGKQCAAAAAVEGYSSTSTP